MSSKFFVVSETPEVFYVLMKTITSGNGEITYRVLHGSKVIHTRTAWNNPTAMSDAMRGLDAWCDRFGVEIDEYVGFDDV